MIRLTEKEVKEKEGIQQVDLDGMRHYSVEDVAKLLGEDLSGVEAVSLFDRPFATLEKINAGRKREELSDFNKKLLQARHFKK